jgi:ankyrin repeat protein
LDEAALGKADVVRELLDSLGHNWKPRRFRALQSATRTGDLETIQLLLSRGYDAEAEVKDSTTSLHIAASRGNAAAVRALLVAGFHVDAKSSEGRTALEEAMLKKRVDVVEIFAEMAETDYGSEQAQQ